MEPKVRYARTSDGVRIAFWTVGEGPPLVHLSWGELSNCQAEWENPMTRGWFERLAQRRMVVRHDHRGSGLSDRKVDSFSVEAFVRDVESVVDELGLERFALMGTYGSGIVALTYAAAHPERVSRLLFWCSYARPRDYEHTPGAEAERAMSGKDWGIYSELVSRLVMGWSDDRLGEQVAEYIRTAVDEETLPKIFRALATDATELLPKITAPALVMHRKEYRFPDIEAAKFLASELPNARLALFDGDTGVPFPDITETVTGTIEEFLAEGDVAGLPDGISEREAEVLRLVAAGRSNRQIGDELTISVNTVDRHVSNIYMKIGATNRAEAASYAVRNGLA